MSLKRLYEITEQLLADETFENGLEPILEQTARLINASAAAIVQLIDEETPVCLETFPADLLTSDAEDYVTDLADELIANNDRFTTDALPPEESNGWASLLAVPIGGKDTEEPGVLLFFSTKPDAFSDEDKYLAGIVGNQITLFFDNVDLYEVVEQSNLFEEGDFYEEDDDDDE